MKRVILGYQGGFPLEQETLIQIQAAYEEDMLEALFALWGLDRNGKYLLKESSDTEQGWIIMPVEIQVKGGENVSPMKKLQLIKLAYKSRGTTHDKINIVDKRKDNGDLPYANGVKNKVYEEFIAVYNPKGKYSLSTFKRLPSLLQIQEDYLPRDGSKPMTGDLNLGSNQMSKLDTNETFTARVRAADLLLGYSTRRGQDYPNMPLGRALVDAGSKTLSVNHEQDWQKTLVNGEVIMPHLNQSSSQVPLVIDKDGNVGRNPNGISSANFLPGMVMMWSGNPSSIPTGWVLCDGNNNVKINNLTIPDLRGRFVVGYDKNSSTSPVVNYNKTTDNYGKIHNKGGLRDVRLTTNEIPAHKHKMQLTSGAFFPTKTRNPGGAGEGHRRTMDEALDNNAYTDNSTGGGQTHENRPPYYVLAFIVFVGEYNANPTARITYNDNTTLQKTSVVEEGETFVVNLVGTSSSDSDGTIATYFWEKCFESEPWTSIGTTTTGTLQYTIPANKYGLHYFRLRKVVDNEGAESTASNELRYRINRPVIIQPVNISVKPTSLSFTDSGLAGVKHIDVKATPGWRIKENPGNLTLNPSSSNTAGITNVAVMASGVRRTRASYVLLETTDGSATARFTWSQTGIVSGGGGGCFDLESDMVMGDGSSKKLKDVVVGDTLSTYKFVKPLVATDKTTTLFSDLMEGATKVASKVVDFGTKTVTEYRRITLVDGTVLNVTASHPILVSKNRDEVVWLLPDDIRGGYFIVNQDGKLVEIQSKRTVKESLNIGVLQLEGSDNYFVQNVMVHNAKIVRAVARAEGEVTAKEVGREDIVDKIAE